MREIFFKASPVNKGSLPKDNICVSNQRDSFAAKFKVMSKYLQSILNLLDKTQRQIEINSSDYPFDSLWRIAQELKKEEKTMSLVVENNLTDTQIEQLIDASGDRFFFKM